MKERLESALKVEMISIAATFDSMAAINGQFIPLIEAIHIAPTRTQINEIIKHLIQIQKKYIELLTEYESLANKCKQISINTGYMKELGEYNTRAFDLINRLGETSSKNKIEFTDGFYGFIQLYGNEPFKVIKKKEMSQIIKKAENLINIVRTVIKPSLTHESVSRENRKEFIKVCKELVKVAKRFKVKYTKIIEINNYVPENLRFLASMFEENYPLDSEMKKANEYNKKE